MNIKKVIIYSSAIVVTLLLLAGCIFYAFKLQGHRDQEETDIDISQEIEGANENDEDEQINISPDPSPTPLVDDDTDTDEAVDEVEEAEALPISIVFAGDINFDENSRPMRKYDQEDKGILGGISQGLIDEMNQADIMMLNNEFAYSLRGTKAPDKSYTFRANPQRVNILHEMGVDIVSLANNHVLDYGEEAFYDTLEALDDAEIDYVGAGLNRDDAKAPIYYTIGNKTIGIVAASRVIPVMEWYATDTRPGVIGTYNPSEFIPSIEEAKENSDFVVAYVHWGQENTHKLLDYQRNMAKQYIDAGVDAVIGCHPHVLQGIEFYKGKPIAYSLGNFWFSSATRETALFKLILNTDDSVDVQIIPAMCKDTYTYMIDEEEEKEKYFDFIQSISFNIEIDDKGFIQPQ